GRRFVPASGPQSWNGINYFTSAIDEKSSTLLLDLSNALQLANSKGEMRQIGKLTVGILLDPSASEKDPVTSKNFELLGEIDYSADGWLFGTSGIHAVPLTESQLKSAQTAPLALAAEQPSGTNLFAIRESADGLFSCAEEFVQRIDSPDKSSVVVHTAQCWKALPAANCQLSLLRP